MKFKILSKMRNKVLALLLLVMFIPLLVTSFYSVKISTDTLKEKAKLDFTQYTRFSTEQIKGFLKGVEGDIALLKNNPYFARLLEESENGAVYKRVVEDFFFLSHIRKIYNQVRYIDESGNEVVRINYDHETHKITSSDELQNKKNRYYFKQTLALPPGQIFVSPLDLNRERGKVERPLNPMIRYATPVFNKKGEKKGIIILNVFANHFLDAIKEKHSLKNENTFLINKDGFYLKHHDSSKEWGGVRDLDTGENIFKDYPVEITSQIISGRSGIIEYQNELISYAPIFPSQDKKTYWIFINSYLKKEVFEPVTAFERTFSVIIGISSLIAIFIGIIFSSHVTKPLRRLNYWAKKIAAGDFLYNVTIKTGDEIEELGNSLRETTLILCERELDLKAINQNLKASEEKYRELVGTAEDAIVSINNKGNIILFNKSAEKLFGYENSEVMGKNIIDLMPEEFRDPHKKGLMRFLQTEKSKIIGKPIEVVGLSRQGEQFPVELSISAMKIDEKYTFTGIIRDIGERKKYEEGIRKKNKELQKAYDDLKHAAEMLRKAKNEIEDKARELEKSNKQLKETTAQLVQSAKLSSLGEMTAGIAHEMNQPLNNINLTSQSMLMDMERNAFSEQEIKADLHDIIDEVKRMSEIIDHMRIFTRKSDDTYREEIDINSVIEGVFKLVGQQLKVHNFEVKKDLDPNLPDILADYGELGQVFTNLIVNARDAVEGFREKERKIEIKSYQNQKEENQSPEIIVEVKDNGGGISDEIKDRILEPFFTTKAPGKGTGLGLSIVDRIVKEHHGRIEVESQVGEGSLFRIILPVRA